MLHRHRNMSGAAALDNLQSPAQTKAFGPAAMLEVDPGPTAGVARPLIIAMATSPNLRAHASTESIG